MDYTLQHLIIGSSGESPDHLPLCSPYHNTACDAAMPNVMTALDEEHHHSCSVMMSFCAQSPEQYHIWPGGRDRSQIDDDDHQQAQRLLIAACVSSSSSSSNFSNSSHEYDHKTAASRPDVKACRRGENGAEIISQQQQQQTDHVWPQLSNDPHGCLPSMLQDQLAASTGFSSSDLSHASLDRNDHVGPHDTRDPFSSVPPLSPINKPHFGGNVTLNRRRSHRGLISTSSDCHSNITHHYADIADHHHPPSLQSHLQGRRAKKVQTKSMQISFSRGLMMSSSSTSTDELCIDGDDHSRDIHMLRTKDVASSQYYHPPTLLSSDLIGATTDTPFLSVDDQDYLGVHGDNSTADAINEALLLIAADAGRPKRVRACTRAADAKLTKDSLARHCGAERKRRQKLNSKFEALRALVCPSLSVKTSKADIIECAINLLKQQQKEIEATREEKHAEIKPT